jgi:CRISPR system Cascade subunit CasB
MAETEEPANKPYYRYLKNDQPAELMAWWKALDDNRGERAELRGAETPDEVLPAKAFHALCRVLPRWESRDLLALATVAGILAHVKTNDNLSLPRQLGQPKEKGGDKPAFSELRFQQLLSCQDHAEFFQRLRRAVQMMDGTADVCRLADDILRWAVDRLDATAEKPSQKFRYTWARDYFAPTLNPKQGA